MLKKILVVGAAALALAACESTSSLPYQVSTQNVLVAQGALRAADAEASVGTFTAADGVDKPMCRLMGQLDIAPGKDVPTFVRDALESELFQTGQLAAGGTGDPRRNRVAGCQHGRYRQLDLCRAGNLRQPAPRLSRDVDTYLLVQFLGLQRLPERLDSLQPCCPDTVERHFQQPAIHRSGCWLNTIPQQAKSPGHRPGLFHFSQCYPQLARTASSSSATILVILIIGLTAGPAVSL